MVKFNRRSSGSGASAYLLSPLNWVNELRPSEPLILRGDPEDFDECVRVSGYAQPYLSGEFSWGEDFEVVGREEAEKTVMGFIRLLAAGIPLSEFALLLVLHRRKRGFDIHFLLGKAHLRTGLQFRFYRDTDYDEALKRDYRRRVNLLNGWSDVEDVENRSLKTHPSPYAKPQERRAHEKFDERVVGWLQEGVVINRKELIATLQNEGLPFEPIKKDNGIEGIKLTYEGHTLSLLGGKYAPGFDFEAARSHRATRRERSGEDINREIAGLSEKLALYGSQREAMYQAAFAGGNLLFDAAPEAEPGSPVQGIPLEPGAPGEPGEAFSPLAGGGKTDGASATSEELSDEDARGPGVRAPVPHVGGDSCMGGTGSGESDLEAFPDEDSGGGKRATAFSGDLVAPAAGSKGQDPAVPPARRNLGGGGTGSEIGTWRPLLGERGEDSPRVAHPSQGTVNQNQDTEYEIGIELIEIIAELMRRVGQALCGAEHGSAEAERALGILIEGAERALGIYNEEAGRERETLERVGGSISAIGGSAPGVEEAELRRKNPGDDDYEAAYRELESAVDQIGPGAYEALDPEERPRQRPALPNPEVGPKIFEPSL